MFADLEGFVINSGGYPRRTNCHERPKHLTALLPSKLINKCIKKNSYFA